MWYVVKLSQSVVSVNVENLLIPIHIEVADVHGIYEPAGRELCGALGIYDTEVTVLIAKQDVGFVVAIALQFPNRQRT